MDAEIDKPKRKRGRPATGRLTAAEYQQRSRKKKAEQGMTVIEITLPIFLVEYIDELAKLLDMNRSQVIKGTMIKEMLQQQGRLENHDTSNS